MEKEITNKRYIIIDRTMWQKYKGQINYLVLGVFKTQKEANEFYEKLILNDIRNNIHGKYYDIINAPLSEIHY